jgi:opacity protein-like surface antigen
MVVSLAARLALIFRPADLSLVSRAIGIGKGFRAPTTVLSATSLHRARRVAKPKVTGLGPSVPARATPSDRVLFYATGGGAFGNVQTGLNTLSLQSNTEFGWTAGAGIEWAFADNWTAKVEYLYVDLGNATCNTSANCGFDSASPAVASNNSVSFTESMIRAGVNFKFNGW